MTLLRVSFGTYRRRRRDVLVGRREDVPLRRLWVFETSWRCTDGFLCLPETSPQCSNKMLWRPTTETSRRRSTELLSVSFETHLQRRWDVQKDVVTTSL